MNESVRRPSEIAAGHGSAGDSDEIAHVELSDEDIVDAMKHIEGYLDITAEDFKEVYALAHRHAEDRLLGALQAERLMRTGVAPLAPGTMLDEAARALVKSGFKGLPVVDADGRVIGMLTETDFLRRLKANTFLDLLLKMIDDSCGISHRCHETPVREAMTAPAITVRPQAGFREMMAAFRRHTGRGMPVAGEDGRLRGLLLRKDFLEALDRGAHG